MNDIFVNHVGFPCLAQKRFLVKDPQETTFRVEALRHTVYKPVFTGTLQQEDDEFWSGDFTAVTEPCDYRIVVGEKYGRHFVIHDGAYDMAQRLMLSYFTMQRCGSPLGWAGMCHQEDGMIAETGEQVDLRGGYHQSADLRKSPAGVSIGVIGLLRWALVAKPVWDVGTVADELRWACDYYLKTVQPNGCVYNTLNAPLGWDGRLFYASGAPDCAQWNTLQILAMGARYFSADIAYAQKLLQAAKRIWSWMTRPDRPAESYRHPDILPRGMDADTFYAPSFKDSASDLCSRLGCAVALYRAEGGSAWEEEILSTAERVCNCIYADDPEKNPAAGAMLLAENELRLMACGGTYAWVGMGPNALCDACEVLPFAPQKERWMQAIRLQADLRVRMAKLSVWHGPGSIASEESMAVITGHPAPGRPIQRIGDGYVQAADFGFIKNTQGTSACRAKSQDSFTPTSAAENAVFLRRAARILGDESYLAFAQQSFDGIVGCNFLDMSSVESVGYRQFVPPVFGQFFPSTPQIPGGVFHTGAHEPVPETGCFGEYDMPAVGLCMWAIAELGTRVEYAKKLNRDQYDIYWKH